MLLANRLSRHGMAKGCSHSRHARACPEHPRLYDRRTREMIEKGPKLPGLSAFSQYPRKPSGPKAWMLGTSPSMTVESARLAGFNGALGESSIGRAAVASAGVVRGRMMNAEFGRPPGASAHDRACLSRLMTGPGRRAPERAEESKDAPAEHTSGEYQGNGVKHLSSVPPSLPLPTISFARWRSHRATSSWS